MPSERELALQAKAWPFEEARKLVARYADKPPANVPNQEMLAQYLGKPLTVVPDPFGKYESFGHHNNAMLRGFLDGFGFDYEFQSSSDWYRSGRFDSALRKVLELYDAIMEVMLPSLREERAQTYSPFLPV